MRPGGSAAKHSRIQKIAMRSKALTIILLLAVIALFVALSRSAAIRAAERVITDLDPSQKLGFMMSGTSPVLTPERKLLGRVAYFQRDIFTGNPVVIHVSPLGHIEGTEPKFIGERNSDRQEN